MNIIERELANAIIISGAQTEREEALLALIDEKEKELDEKEKELYELNDHIWNS